MQYVTIPQLIFCALIFVFGLSKIVLPKNPPDKYAFTLLLFLLALDLVTMILTRAYTPSLLSEVTVWVDILIMVTLVSTFIMDKINLQRYERYSTYQPMRKV